MEVLTMLGVAVILLQVGIIAQLARLSDEYRHGTNHLHEELQKLKRDLREMRDWGRR